MSRLDTAEAERAASWHLVIATILIPASVTFVDEGADRHWLKQGGLYISRADGSIRWHALDIFGRNTVRFVRALQKHFHGLEYFRKQAEAWIQAFLAKPEHQGTGPLEPELAADSKTRRIANAERARQLGAEAVLLTTEHDGGRYLESRGVPGPWPLALLWHPHVRTGEGAILAPLTSSGRVTAYLITYVTPLATKSTVEPQRIRLNLEPGHRGAVMAIADREPGCVDINADTILCEGLENALSLARIKRPGWRIAGLPGIGAAKRLRPERPGERIIFFQDSDPEGRPARAGLQAGIDALKLAGAKVSCTAFSELGDANAILQHRDPEETDKPHGGAAELTRLTQTAVIAPFSFAGETERLAKLSRTEYEQARRSAAAEQGVRVGHLDREVALRRPKPPGAEDPSAVDGYTEPEDEPWSGPIPELSHILDSAVAAMPRFLLAPQAYYDVMTLWAAASYLVQSELIALPIMPQLSFQSAGPESGKSTGLEITATLSYRGRLRSSYTAATVFRRISAEQSTMCLVDLHTVLTDPRSELHQVVKACHRRAEATVDRTEEHSGGSRYIKAYRCWAALAWASIGPLFEEMQGRAIILPLRPALPHESRELAHSSPSRCPELIDARRQLAVWALGVATPLDPVIPEPLYSRIADNWRPLVAIAEMAKGDWPVRVAAAIEELRQIEHRPPYMTRLLTAIRDAFDARAQRNAKAKAVEQGSTIASEDLFHIGARPTTRLTTGEICEALNSDAESGLGETNHGRGITPYTLRDHFRHLSIRSRDWWVGQKGAQKHLRGYYREQFDDSFARHRVPPRLPFPPSGVSGVSGVPTENPSIAAGLGTPDGTLGTPDAEEPSGVPKAAGSLAVAAGTPDTPDTPDTDKGGGAGVGTPSGTRPSIAELAATLSRIAADGHTAPETTKTTETRDPTTGSPARPKRRPRAVLDSKGPPTGNGALPQYTAGTLPEVIRKLRGDNPHRSLTWIAHQIGQPKSYVRDVLGLTDGGDAP
jgi:hypothetical protein